VFGMAGSYRGPGAGSTGEWGGAVILIVVAAGQHYNQRSVNPSA